MKYDFQPIIFGLRQTVEMGVLARATQDLIDIALEIGREPNLEPAGWPNRYPSIRSIMFDATDSALN